MSMSCHVGRGTWKGRSFFEIAACGPWGPATETAASGLRYLRTSKWNSGLRPAVLEDRGKELYRPPAPKGRGGKTHRPRSLASGLRPPFSKICDLASWFKKKRRIVLYLLRVWGKRIHPIDENCITDSGLIRDSRLCSIHSYLSFAFKHNQTSNFPSP
jgi:hypothetical protein